MYVAYMTRMRAYSDVAGDMTMGFAVDFDRNAWLWRDSVYTKQPDPSLVLPQKYYYVYNPSIKGSEWRVTEDERTATAIRGVRFYSLETLDYTTGALYQGHKYRVSVPVYNASFVDAGDVEAALSYQKKGAPSTRKEIGRSTVKLGGWLSGTENNKGTLTFDWTVDADPAEYYEFFVELDPDNALDEVHEAWSATVPGGNNTGYANFTVLDAAATASGMTSAKLAAEDSKFMPQVRLAAEDQEDDLYLPNSKEFYEYVLKQTEPFVARFKLLYVGTPGAETLTDVTLEMSEKRTNDVGQYIGEPYRHVIVDHNIPALYSDNIYQFSVLIDPQGMTGEDFQARLVTAGNVAVGLLEFNGSADDGASSDAKKSSGGCDLGLGGLAALGLVLVVAVLRKK